MSIRLICDRCGEIDKVGRFTLNPAVSVPHATNALPKFDGELCDVCLTQVCQMIHEALSSKRR
jgi:hypothetical protein